MILRNRFQTAFCAVSLGASLVGMPYAAYAASTKLAANSKPIYLATESSDGEQAPVPSDQEIRESAEAPEPISVPTPPASSRVELSGTPKKNAKAAKKEKKKLAKAPTTLKRIEILEAEVADLKKSVADAKALPAKAPAAASFAVKAESAVPAKVAPGYDPVPSEQRDSMVRRLQLVQQLIEKHARAYDYRMHTVGDLQKILASLETPKPKGPAGISPVAPAPSAAEEQDSDDGDLDLPPPPVK
jgi:hypothetical protein